MSRRFAFRSLLIIIAVPTFACAAAACGESPRAPAVAPVDVQIRATEPASTIATSTSAPPAAASAAPAPAPAPASAPALDPPSPPSPPPGKWLPIALKTAGDVLLRCEDTAEHPTDVAGGCLCGTTILNPCAGEARPSHVVDRRQCLFRCAASPAKTYRLTCPDGASSSPAAAGCACGDRVLSPCGAASPASVQMAGGACSVACP